MASASATTFIGNLTADPELRITGNGTSKLTFSVACSHYWNDQAGEKQEKTSFFNVVAWRNLADDAAALLEKGMRVVVVGRLEQRSYEDKEGNNRSVVELVADEIALVARSLESVVRKRRTDAGSYSAPAARKPAQRSTIQEDSEPF
jgi:single-strand DNA-binding protein